MDADSLPASAVKLAPVWVVTPNVPRFVRAVAAFATSLRFDDACSAPVMRESLPAATVPAVVPTLSVAAPPRPSAVRVVPARRPPCPSRATRRDDEVARGDAGVEVVERRGDVDRSALDVAGVAHRAHPILTRACTVRVPAALMLVAVVSRAITRSHRHPRASSSTSREGDAVTICRTSRDDGAVSEPDDAVADVSRISSSGIQLVGLSSRQPCTTYSTPVPPVPTA